MKNGNYELVIAPPNFPGKKYRGKYCSKHVLVYWQTYGVLPKPNEIIHHKDEDKFNNDPDNLELMKRKDHVKLHRNTHGRKLVELKCPGCGKIFIKERNKTFLQKGGTYTCCCRKCVGIATHLPLRELHNRISENVIREFIDDKTKYGL